MNQWHIMRCLGLFCNESMAHNEVHKQETIRSQRCHIGAKKSALQRTLSLIPYVDIDKYLVAPYLVHGEATLVPMQFHLAILTTLVEHHVNP